MPRTFYQIKLKECFFPAVSAEDALDMYNNGACCGGLHREEVDVGVAVNAEHTVKLFMLAKAMYDSEKFNCDEVEAAVRAVACKMGYPLTCEQIASSVIHWVERVGEDMTLAEMEEWLIND